MGLYFVVGFSLAMCVVGGGEGGSLLASVAGAKLEWRRAVRGSADYMERDGESSVEVAH